MAEGPPRERIAGRRQTSPLNYVRWGFHCICFTFGNVGLREVCCIFYSDIFSGLGRFLIVLLVVNEKQLIVTTFQHFIHN